MPVAKSVKRRSALRAALASTAENETITIDEMMVLWGTSKGTFVNTRNLIPHFPDAKFVGDRGVIHYPRKEAIEALIAWEERDDTAMAQKSERLNKLLGISDQEAVATPSLSDMAKASALRAEADARMVQQRLLIPKAEVQRTAARVLEIVSRTLGHLDAIADPHGKLAPATRTNLKIVGEQAQLRVYGELKDMLAPNVEPDIPERASKARKRPGEAGVPPVPRKRGGGVDKPPRDAPARAKRNNDRVGDKKSVSKRSGRAKGKVEP